MFIPLAIPTFEITSTHHLQPQLALQKLHSTITATTV